MSNLADWTFLDAAYRRGLAPEPQTISLGLGRAGEARLRFITLAAHLADLRAPVLGWGGLAAFFPHPTLFAWRSRPLGKVILRDLPPVSIRISRACAFLAD